MFKKFFYLTIFATILAACTKDIEEVSEPGMVSFQIATNSDGGGRLDNDDQPVAVLITINDADGNAVYDNSLLPIFEFNGAYVTESLSLEVGSYTLEEFLVINENNEIIYLTPKQGSALANLVSHALPIAFDVAVNETTEVALDVLPADLGTLEDFGYAKFSFGLPDTVICVDNLNYLEFDGADDRVTIPASDDFNIGTGDFTMEAWFKGDEAGQVAHPQLMASRQSNGFLFGFHNRWNGSAHKIPYVGMGRFNYIVSDNVPNMLDGEWHHFAATRSGDQLNYFLDGEPWVSFTLYEDPAQVSISSGIDLWVGHDSRSPGNTAFEGAIAEVRLWNVARSADEIGLFFNRALTGQEAGLVFNLNVVANQGQVVFDKTGQHSAILGSGLSADAQDPVWASEADVCR